MWKNSKPKSSSYFSDHNGTIMARAVRGELSDAEIFPPRVMPSSLPTRSALPLRMVISDMARRTAPSSSTIKNLTQTPPSTALEAYLQESRGVYPGSQCALFEDKYQQARKNKTLTDHTPNVINHMRKKFNLMYGKPNDDKDEREEDYVQINEADQTSNPQKKTFSELYGRRPEFPPPDMLSFAEFVERVNKKSSIMTPQKRSWTDESFDGKTDAHESSADASVLNRSTSSSQQSWKKRYLATELFLHSIKEDWPEEDDENNSLPISSGVEEIKEPKDSPNDDDSMDIRKRKGGIFDDSFKMSPKKKILFSPHPFGIFGNDGEGDTSGEESVTSEAVTTAEVLNNDVDNKTSDYPFFEDLLNVCSQDSISSDDLLIL